MADTPPTIAVEKNTSNLNDMRRTWHAAILSTSYRKEIAAGVSLGFSWNIVGADS